MPHQRHKLASTGPLCFLRIRWNRTNAHVNLAFPLRGIVLVRVIYGFLKRSMKRSLVPRRSPATRGEVDHVRSSVG